MKRHLFKTMLLFIESFDEFHKNMRHLVKQFQHCGEDDSRDF